MDPASVQVQSQESFDRIFSLELLKSEYRRSLLIAILAGIAVVMGFGVMTLGRSHFESIGDRGGSRYWLLVVGAGLAMYELACTRILARRIREGQHTPGGLGILNAVIEPTAITAWLLLEGLLVQPGAMFDSQQSLAVGFVLLEGKHAAGSICDGKLTELSAKSAKLSTPEKLELLSDLKIMLRQADGEPVPGHVLAKVVDATDAGFLLRFTSVEPGPSKFLEGILAAARAV